MSNDYFTHSDLTRLTLARAENVNALFQAIQDGLDKLPGADLFKERRTSYVADTGAADAYVVTFAQPIPTAYAVGMTIDFVPSATNTGACTINVNALGAKQILQADGSTPAAGMIVAGRVNTLKYDGTAFRVFSVSSTVTPVDGSVTTAKLASSAVTQAKIAGSVWSALAADIVPDADSTRKLGSSSKAWAQVHVDDIASQSIAGHIFGQTLSNNSTDGDHDIDIAAGSAATDDTTPISMRLASSLTKQLDAAWAVGTNAGGLDTGSIAANTWYHVWLIQRSDTGVVDALSSTSATSPTMPANYDRKRRIGSVLTDGSANIIPFKQTGDYFQWDLASVILEVSVTGFAVPTTATLQTLTTPPGVKCMANLTLYVQFHRAYNTFMAAHVWDPDVTEPTSATAYADAALYNANAPSTSNYNGVTVGHRVMTDVSSQVKYKGVNNSTYSRIDIYIKGYWDPRGRFG